jgi:hypothetical protein
LCLLYVLFLFERKSKKKKQFIGSVGAAQKPKERASPRRDA